MGGASHEGKKADCHLDHVANTEDAKLVELNTRYAHGVTVNDTGR